MARFRGERGAFGAPGADPHWSHANKDGVGTAYDLESRIWFTIWNGILTEIHYPTVDRPQVRDIQFLFIDADGKILDEKRDMRHEVERITPSQGYRVVSTDKDNRFSSAKEIITDPRRASVLIHVEMKGQKQVLQGLKAYLLCNPHLNSGGRKNNAYIVEVSGQELLVAEKEDRWMVAGASCGFSKLSCGYMGQSDGYTDLHSHGEMTFEFDEAKDGNVTLTGEVDRKEGCEFTIALAFGDTLSSATACLFQSMHCNYKHQRGHFIRG